MKTRSFQGLSLAFALAVLPRMVGCNQETGGSSQNATNAAAGKQPAPPVADDSTNSFHIRDSAIPAPPSERRLPANVKPSEPVTEVIKLVNSGVEQDVLLAYVNSSQSAFNLTSDEIIYLTDLGVPDDVVTAMIDRDQILKQAWSAAVAVTVPADFTTEAPPTDQELMGDQETVAAAPSYTDGSEPYPVEEPPPVEDYDYFYDNLTPYGSWVNLDGYGWCWQPTVVVVNPGWQPYCDRGRWLYTDCGWYWQSDYSWGMTFHYGRWFNHPAQGWCWWPDQVWSPSWVTWRYNDNYCGWAPLPPQCHYRPGYGLGYHSSWGLHDSDFGLGADCYTFVTWRGFCDRRPSQHRLPAGQVATVINRTTVVNDFRSGNNNTVINRGVAPDQVTRNTRQPVQRVALRDAERRTARNFNGDNERGSSTLASRTGRGPLQGNQATSRTSSEAQPQVPATPESNPALRDARIANARDSSSGTPRLAPGGEGQDQPGSDIAPDRAPPATSLNTDTRSSRNNAAPGNGFQGNRARRNQSIIVRGSDQAAPPPGAQDAPPGSLVIIGRRDSGQPRPNSRYVPPSSPAYGQNQDQAPMPSVVSREPVVSVVQPVDSVQDVNRAWQAPVTVQVRQRDEARFNQRAESRIEARQPHVPAASPAPAAPNPAPAASRPAPQQTRSAPPPAVVDNPDPPAAAPSAPPAQAQPAQNRGGDSAPRSSNSGGSGNGGGVGRPGRQR
jgi:hypothetical protein